MESAKSGRSSPAILLTGSPQRFAVRPEKIAMVDGESPTPDGSIAALGTVRDVVYLGMHTRYLVTLDGGSDVTVMQQNLETTSMHVLESKGKRVKLLWRPEHNHALGAER